MWDKEGRGGEFLVLPGEPELVASVPRQGVEVVEEGALLHVLPHERVEGGQGGLVPVVYVACRAHFKTIHCACIVCDVCEEWSVFVRFLIVALINVHGQGDGEFKDVELLFRLVHNHNVWFKIRDAEI